MTDKLGVARTFGTATTLAFTGGVSTTGGSMVLDKVETVQIAATAGALTTTGADRLAVSVVPAATDHLTVSAGSSQTAGSSFTTTVTAKDSFGNVTPAYTGQITFGSNDGQAILPSPYTFTGPDAGTQTFTVTLKTAGNRTVSAADGSITGSTSPTVAPAATSQFDVSTDAANPQAAGSAFTTTVVARDTYGNTTPAYTGTVALTTGDPLATLPSYAFTGADNGVHAYATTLKTTGAQTITASDGSHNGAASVTSAAAAADHFTVTTDAGSPQTAGGSFTTSVASRTPSATRSPATPAPSTSPRATSRRCCRPTTPSSRATTASRLLDHAEDVARGRSPLPRCRQRLRDGEQRRRLRPTFRRLDGRLEPADRRGRVHDDGRREGHLGNTTPSFTGTSR